MKAKRTSDFVSLARVSIKGLDAATPMEDNIKQTEFLEDAWKDAAPTPSASHTATGTATAHTATVGGIPGGIPLNTFNVAMIEEKKKYKAKKVKDSDDDDDDEEDEGEEDEDEDEDEDSDATQYEEEEEEEESAADLDGVVARGDKLDDLERKTQQLTASSKAFMAKKAPVATIAGKVKCVLVWFGLVLGVCVLCVLKSVFFCVF